MRDQAERRCAGCGCALSQYNAAERCGPCSRSPLLTPVSELWATAQAKQAIGSWDLAAMVSLYRRHTGATQERIAAAVGIAQSEVSRMQRGTKKIRDRQQLLTWTRALGVPDRLIPASPALTEPDRSYASGLTTADLVRAIADIEAAVETTTGLWRTDGDLPPLSDVDLSAPVLAWLTSGQRSVSGRTGRRRVGMSDVEDARTALDTFAHLDNEHGGGRAREACTRYLLGNVAPMLTGSFTARTGKALYTVACEFTLLVAWMAYDIGDANRARAGFAHALALAQAADDRQLGASVLSAMSHQANHYGNPRQALVFARAALDGVPPDASPTLLAQFSAMSARAAARLGERGECERALASAESALGRTDHDAPAWISYFDECEFADEAAHCFRDLGLFRRAVDSALDCLEYPDQGSPRSRIFSRVVLAESLLGDGDAEEGAKVALETLPLIAQTASLRTVTYLAELRSRAEEFSGVPPVAEFLSRSKPSRGATGAADRDRPGPQRDLRTPRR